MPRSIRNRTTAAGRCRDTSWVVRIRAAIIVFEVVDIFGLEWAMIVRIEHAVAIIVRIGTAVLVHELIPVFGAS